MDTFELKVADVAAIRDPIALALYTYVVSLEKDRDPPSTEEICKHFNIGRKRLKTAFVRLDELGLV
jgi:hypothetical protein